MAHDGGELDAGDFSAWLRTTEAAIVGQGDADVPCAGCTACCRSSQFVPIGPDETDTLAHIPPALLFPAPRRPRGHVVLGYDEAGCCPMLGDRGCTIYEHRPRACRTYDCRVFAATGVVDDDKPLVAERVRRWRFRYPRPEDESARGAVEAAAAYLEAHPEVTPDARPLPPTPRAVLAVELHQLFANGARPDEATVRDRVARRPPSG